MRLNYFHIYLSRPIIYFCNLFFYFSFFFSFLLFFFFFFVTYNNFLFQEMNHNTYHFIAFADRCIEKMVCNLCFIERRERILQDICIISFLYRSALNINKLISIIHNHTRPEKNYLSL